MEQDSTSSPPLAGCRTGVAVGGIGVAVGGIGVAVGGTRVAVGRTSSAGAGAEDGESDEPQAPTISAADRIRVIAENWLIRRICPSPFNYATVSGEAAGDSPLTHVGLFLS